MRGSSAYRLSVTPGGVLAGPWVRNDLWRRARAVPSLDLRFADNESLVDATTGQNLVSFTRASSGTYVDSQGVIRTATTNEPRFDHNPTTGESLGLLVEESRTNLLQRSEEFDNAYWTKGGSTISANSATAPDGLTTADKLVEDTSTGSHRLYVGTTSLAASTAHSLSVYVKAAGRTFIRVEARDSAGVFAAQDFNLTTLAITSAGSGTGSISSLGNGWYRCTVTGTSSASGGVGTVLFWALSAPSGTSYTGDGTSGLLLWGAQLEAGAFPTSYIPTTTAAVTRSADVATNSGASFSSWFNSSAMTVYSEASSASGAAYSGYIYSIGADFNNSIQHYRQSDFQPVARVRTAGADEYGAIGNGAVWTGTSVNKFALALSATSGRQASNGLLTAGSDDTSITFPSMSSMTIGFSVGGSSYFNGHIRRLAFFPQRLSNPVLQAITQ